MFVNSVEVVVDKKRAELEAALKGADNLDSYDIEDLDGVDERKSVLLAFGEPVDARYLGEVLNGVIGEEIKRTTEE